MKGDTQRVKDLLEKGNADVRYQKPRDEKPRGFPHWTPTQVAIYMGKTESLEMLLQEHTLFTETQLVQATKWLQKHNNLQQFVAVPALTCLSYLCPFFMRYKPAVNQDGTPYSDQSASDKRISTGKELRKFESMGEEQMIQAAHTADLINLGLKSWCRGSLELLIMYGADLEAALPHNHSLNFKGGRRSKQARVARALFKELYDQCEEELIETKIRKTACCALYHPADLDWVLDQKKGNVLGLISREAEVSSFYRKVFRKIKDEIKCTKEMKVAALKTFTEHAIRHLNLPQVTVDLGNVNIDDNYLDHILTAWDSLIVLGVPTALMLEDNMITQFGVRSLVLATRALDNGLVSITSLNLNNNRIGIDGALFLADYIHDSDKSLCSVTVHRHECCSTSPNFLTFERSVDRNLNLEEALTVAILVDAYSPLKKFVFTLREAEDEFPEAFARLQSLEELDLRGNHLHGSVPAPLLRIPKKNFCHNELHLPLDIDDLRGLSSLSLCGAGLVGEIPRVWSTLTNLTSLDLSRNNLHGPIPSELICSVRSLQLGGTGNNLCLPVDVRGLMELTSINLAGKSLVGTIPETFTSLSKLSSLDLSSNRLTGSVPASLFTKLTHFSFAKNQLTLPTDVKSLIRIHSLDLSNQGLQGSIPETFSTLVLLRSLNLSGNCLEGEIPTSLILLPKHWFGRNKLRLPSNVSPLLDATIIDLNSQDLWGTIPTSWSRLTSLQTLDLGFNHLNGPVPANLLALSALELAGNELELPEGVGALSAVRDLNLKDQHLTGFLPESWSMLSNLEVLNLSGRNYLTGAIPPGLLQKSLNIAGANKFSLPDDLTPISSATLLRLSHSGLVGHLSKGLAVMTQLQELWLQGNNLEVRTASKSRMFRISFICGTPLSLDFSGVCRVILLSRCLAW